MQTKNQALFWIIFTTCRGYISLVLILYNRRVTGFLYLIYFYIVFTVNLYLASDSKNTIQWSPGCFAIRFFVMAVVKIGNSQKGITVEKCSCFWFLIINRTASNLGKIWTEVIAWTYCIVQNVFVIRVLARLSFRVLLLARKGTTANEYGALHIEPHFSIGPS